MRIHAHGVKYHAARTLFALSCLSSLGHEKRQFCASRRKAHFYGYSGNLFGDQKYRRSGRHPRRFFCQHSWCQGYSKLPIVIFTHLVANLDCNCQQMPPESHSLTYQAVIRHLTATISARTTSHATSHRARGRGNRHERLSQAVGLFWEGCTG